MCLASIRLWNDEECQSVQDATLRVLDECGVEVKHEPALKLLAEVGSARKSLPLGDDVDRELVALRGRALSADGVRQ